jgi:hypothetical protein
MASNTQSPREFIKRLRNTLLDLTYRNPLLQLQRLPKRLITFASPSDEIGHAVLSKRTIKLTDLGSEPKPHKRTLTSTVSEDYTEEAVARVLGIDLNPIAVSSRTSNTLQTLYFTDNLHSRARKLEYLYRSTLQETGAHVLYLCIGFLQFPEAPNSKRQLKAPLINIPVHLQKHSSNSQSPYYTIIHTGDEIIENIALAVKLQQTYSIALPSVDDTLPSFEKTYLANISKLVNSQADFTVHHHVSLAILNFTNTLIFHDLDPIRWQYGRSNRLLDHSVICDLTAPTQATISTEQTSSSFTPPVSIPLIYDADSSQLQAIETATTQRQNMVIIGPPGTGKSQTITNLIGAFLAQKKSVLFVAEKLAALEVVKQRLTQAGLEPFILELHSDKTNKKSVLDSIQRSLTTTRQTALPQKHIQDFAQAETALTQYNEYLQTVPNRSLGLTNNEFMWQYIRRFLTHHYSTQLIELRVSDAQNITNEILTSRQKQLKHIEQCFHNLDTAILSKYALVRGLSKAHTQFDVITTHVAISITLLDNINNYCVKFTDYTHNLTVHGYTPSDIQQLVRVYNKIQPIKDYSAELNNIITSRSHLKEAQSRQQILAEQISIHEQNTAQLMENFGQIVPFNHDVYQRIKNNLTEVTHLIPSYADSSNISTTTNELVQLATYLQHCYRQITTQSSSLGLPENITARMDHLKAFYAQSTSWLRFTPAQCTTLSQLTFTADLYTQFVDLVTLHKKLVTMQIQLSEYFNFDNDLPDTTTCQQAIHTLQSRSMIVGIFDPKWRKAYAFYYAHATTNRYVPIARIVEQLTQLHQFITHMDEYFTHPCWELIHHKPSLQLHFDEMHECILLFDQIRKSYLNFGYDLLHWWPNNAEQRLQYMHEMQSMLDSTHGFTISWQKYCVLSKSMFDESNIIGQKLQRMDNLIHAYDSILQFLQKYQLKPCTYNELHQLLDHWQSWDKYQSQVMSSADHIRIFGPLFKGVDSDLNLIHHVLKVAVSIYTPKIPDLARRIIQFSLQSHTVLDDIHNLLTRLTDDLTSFQKQLVTLSKYLLLDNMLSQSWPLETYTTTIRELFHVLQLPAFKHWIEYTSATTAFDTHTPFTQTIQPNLPVFHVPSQTTGTIVDIHPITWEVSIQRKTDLIEVPLSSILDAKTPKSHPLWLWKFLEHGLLPDDLADTYTALTIYSILQSSVETKTILYQRHKQHIQYKGTDKTIIAQQGTNIANNLIHPPLPQGINGSRINDKSEMHLLRYLLPQQRPRIPIRKLLIQAKRSIRQLKPCFMMSPQSIAQFLEPGTIEFDVVIMDEASQMTPGDAIGAIARGKQLIVVGDPKQLPPTQFFSQTDLHSDDIDEHSQIESILDLCIKHLPNVRDLQWHYRSQHHSLVEFSNKHFYDQRLQVFPSPHQASQQLGISTNYIKHAVYKDQINEAEALHIVDLVRTHITQQPKTSLGIVTLNLKQRDLIDDLINDQLGQSSTYLDFLQFWENQGTPMIVKNLESIQGDERDVIIISTTFGPNSEGKIYQNFGPISRELGWRRLNVLFTRAKQAILLVTSLRPYHIQINDNTPKGTVAFANYLEYAFHQDAHQANIPRNAISHHPINEVIIPLLEQHGFSVAANLGYSGFAIDIAIQHPRLPGSFIAAILTDGLYYQHALTVRDRERLHQQILEHMGWNNRIYHIWSNEWYHDPTAEWHALLEFLQPLYAKAMQEQVQDHSSPLYTEISAHTLLENTAQDDTDVLARIKKFLY